MIEVPHRADLIKEAVSIVGGDARKKGAELLKSEIEFAIARVQEVADWDAWPAPGEIAKRAHAIAKTANDLSTKLERMGLPLSHWMARGAALGDAIDLDMLHSLLKKLTAAASFHAEPVRDDSKLSFAREHAAQAAYRMLSAYSRRPTCSKDGPYFRLASILFEVASGDEEADLSRACTKEAHARRRKRKGA